MRNLLATDLGIWPMILNQQNASDMMVSDISYWARIADYLLMYDQIIIPTGNLQILSVLRFVLGDEALLELLETKAIIFTRFDQWFGYIGNVGIIFFRAGHDENTKGATPNLAISHFLPLDEAIETCFSVMIQPTTLEVRKRYKRLLLDQTTLLSTDSMFKDVRDETYRDINESPYLQALLSIRNSGRSLKNLIGSKPDTVNVFNPHVLAGKNDSPEIIAVLNVAFENFLLSVSGSSQASELTGDASTLSVLQAKGQRLGFSPHGRAAFARIQQVNGVPDLGMAFATKQLNVRQIIDLRQSRHAQSFRDWMASGNPSDNADDILKHYINTAGKPSFIESLPVKLLRFATTTVLGAFEPVSGAAASAADTFLLSKWFPRTNPKLFMQQAKVVTSNSLASKAPSFKGRDRNSACSCNSKKKYKHCCGKLS